MEHYQEIVSLNLFFKVGIVCGQTLYYNCNFDNFEKMIEWLNYINQKYNTDMECCIFIIQSFKDCSYNFRESCFSQIRIKVNEVNFKSGNVIAKSILEDYKTKKG